ncbi:MAG: YdcF family protein [Chloroflexi bacterium]|nr:YdcF family protein [Chloroflexota bacterium]
MENQTPPEPGGRKKSGCFLFGSLLGIIALLVLGAFILEFVLSAMGGLLIIADPLKQADAVVVLSGGSDLSRMQEAAQLYKDKYAGMFVLTETGQELSNFNESATFYFELQAMDMGVPSGAILVTEQHVSSTYEEAKAVRKLLEQHHFSSCIVVTDPFHTFRTRLIFREVFKGSEITVQVRPVRNHWYRSTTWWTTAEGREATFQEYVKIFGYFLGFKGD